MDEEQREINYIVNPHDLIIANFAVSVVGRDDELVISRNGPLEEIIRDKTGNKVIMTYIPALSRQTRANLRSFLLVSRSYIFLLKRDKYD